MFFLTLLLSLMCSVSLFAQPDSLWSRTFGGSSNDGTHCAEQTADGGYVLAGYTYSFSVSGELDYWLIKTDADGDSLWTRTFGGAANDVCESVLQTPDGGYILAGNTQSFGSGDYDFWVLKTDADGDSLWSRSFGGPDRDECYCVIRTSDGGYLLSGMTFNYGAGEADFLIVKISENGDSLWSRTFGGSDDEYCYSVRQTIDGFVLAGKTGTWGGGNWDFWLVKTDTNGDSLWSRTFGGIGPDECWTVLRTADGGYLLGGWTYSYGAGDHDYWLVKTDVSGEMVWNRTFGGPERDDCRVVRQTADGGYVMIGSTRSYGNPGGNDFWLVKSDADGDSLWSCTFGGMSGQDYGYYAQQTDDYGFMLAGVTYSFGAGSADVWMVKTGPDPSPMPPTPFMRILPVDCTVLDSSWVQFAWSPSVDPNGDEVTYLLHVESPTYPLPVPADTMTTDTMIWIEIPFDTTTHLDEYHNYFWRVYAVAGEDTVEAWNSEGFFILGIPEPPGPFNRVLPADSALLTVPTVEFVWTSSVDPDFDPVTYLLHIESPTYPFPDPMDYTTTDTTISVEIPWPLNSLDEVHDFFWTVHAAAGGDTVEASNGEGLFRMEIPDAANELPDGVPTEYALSVYPNPFNPATTVSFALPQGGRVALSVYDVTGRVAAVLADEHYPAGIHRLTFDGSAYPSGIYFARLQAEKFEQTQKIILLK